MTMPIYLFVSLSGWVIYRYRETRAMTLAQFFEMRYSRNFRVFAGLVGWVSGVINFGIFPSVGARFFIYFCGIPEIKQFEITFLSQPLILSVTYMLVMIFLLAISIYFVFLGGQIAVMVTDFIQGMFVIVAFMVILVFIFWMFDWVDIVQTLSAAPNPETQSMLDPMKTEKLDSFNPWFFIIGAFGAIYGSNAWQGSQGYKCSASSAHEAKMAGILGEWRGLVLMLVTMLLPIGAYVIMHHPDHVATASAVNATLSDITANTSQKIADQMTVPVALSYSLPIAIKGLMAAVMLAAFISTHDTYLHSWGALFIQDVVLPFRKKPFETKQHIKLLRWSIMFVAVFIFLFSIFFRQNEKILLFFGITGAIYVGGAGSAIIGGLYWKRGSTGGAWFALASGAALAIGGLILGQIWEPWAYPFMAEHAPWLLNAITYLLEDVAGSIKGINWQVTPDKFPIDGQWMWMFSMLIAIVGYIGFSLYSWLVLNKPEHDMDRLLHRGKWAITGDHVGDTIEPVSGWRAILPTKEFTTGDKCIYYAKLVWTIFWFSVFVFGTIYAFNYDVSLETWMEFWWWKVMLTIVIGIGTTIWFFIGGMIDIKKLYKRLRTMERDHRDIGMVIDHHDLSEESTNDDDDSSS
jgi:SSS family solute:Na+ symporter